MTWGGYMGIGRTCITANCIKYIIIVKREYLYGAQCYYVEDYKCRI